jgi:chemotaxis protein methyltransferase CheR
MNIQPPAPIADLSDQTCALFRHLIHRETGIFMKDGKRILISNRLRRRLRELGLASYEEYYRLLVEGAERPGVPPGVGGELARFIDAVSTNETYFYRGENHFQALREVVLPELCAGRSRIRVWSAGCSTGEEPYTIAMIVLENGCGWMGDLEILATDISTAVIARAREGLYRGRTLRFVPPPILARYFRRVSAEEYLVDEPVRRRVTFRVHNLLKDEPPDADFDLIFCRNVMIYFDRLTQKMLVDETFARALAADGYLFIGHSESLLGKSERFRYAGILKSPIYRKRGAP